MHATSQVMKPATRYSRRTALGLAAGVFAMIASGTRAHAAGAIAVTVHKDAGCGCCNGWIEHLRAEGFAVTAIDTSAMAAVKARLGVPGDLASCHTAEVGGYIVEGHVPAKAIRRLLDEKPQATGLSAPGMPMGSPGMEGGTPEVFEVVLFGKGNRRSFGRFRGADQV